MSTVNPGAATSEPAARAQTPYFSAASARIATVARGERLSCSLRAQRLLPVRCDPAASSSSSQPSGPSSAQYLNSEDRVCVSDCCLLFF